MDNSKEYILMCEKAKEMQRYRKPPKSECNDYFYWQGEFHQQRIWLPRQDQLQEMIKEDSPIDLISRLLDVTQTPNYGDNEWCPSAYWENFKSMEQLWLAFVMWQLYKNQWLLDKKEWRNNG